MILLVASVLRTDYPREECEKLALDALVCAHHPLVKGLNKLAWARTVRHLRLEPRQLVAAHLNNLKNTYIEGFTPTEVCPHWLHFSVSPLGTGLSSEQIYYSRPSCCSNMDWWRNTLT